MPSNIQRGRDHDTWASQADRICATYSEQALRRIYPENGTAREYYRAAVRHGRSSEIRRHFARQMEGEDDG